MKSTKRKEKKISLFVSCSLITFILILGHFVVNRTVMAPHSIRLQYGSEYKWAAWEMAYSIKQISTRYPELLPWVHPLHSRIEKVRKEAQGKYENAYYDMHWLDVDGRHVFSSLYKVKGIQNYLQKRADNCILPSPYLMSDETHILKHEFGKGIKEGTYFVAPTTDFESFGPGFFIEILHNGWKLGNVDLHNYEINQQMNNSETISLYKNIQFVSPLLPFGKFILKHKDGWNFHIEVI